MNNDIRVNRDIKPFLIQFKKMLCSKIGNKKQPLVLIQGGFGKYNTGDDTLLLVARDTVLDIYPNAKIIALCYNPDVIQRYYQIEGMYYGSFVALKSLFLCDALVVAGGGLINDVYSTSYLYNIFDPRGKFALFTSLIVSIRKKFTCIFLVGIHAIPNFVVRYLLKLVLPNIDVLGVRDTDSVNKLNQLNIKNYYLAHDAALLYKIKKNISWLELKEKYGIEKKKVLGFNFRYVKEKAISKRAVDEVVFYLKEFNELYPEFDILMIPFSVHEKVEIENDVLALKKVRNILRNKYNINTILIDNYLTPDEEKNILKNVDILVLTRHHGIVLTYEYQIPTIILSYNIKCKQFALLADYKWLFDYYTLNYKDLITATNKILYGEN